MATLNLRISDFDNSVLESLADSTGRSKTSLVTEAIRNLNIELNEERGVTRLSAEAFDGFLEKVLKPETDPQVLEARRKLEEFVPVWER